MRRRRRESTADDSKGKAHLVLFAVDASANTAKKFKDKCRYYHIPFIQEMDREALGKATGRMERVVIAVTDKGFADAMLQER